MIDPRHLRIHVIRPVLVPLGLWSLAAEELLLGTAAKESGLGRYLAQLRGGPALGIFQMEAATHRDLWVNWLSYRQDWWSSLVPVVLGLPDECPGIRGGATLQELGLLPELEERLVYDLRYAALMCRLQYLRKPEPLPSAGEVRAQAEYWHLHWCAGCQGAVEEYAVLYRALVLRRSARRGLTGAPAEDPWFSLVGAIQRSEMSRWPASHET